MAVLAKMRWAPPLPRPLPPTAAAGLALGMASLGRVWDAVLSLHGWLPAGVIAPLMALLASWPLLAVIAKFVRNPHLWWQELAEPLAGSVIPTAAMATMTISAVLAPFAGAVAATLWWLAVAVHLLSLAGFVWRQSSGFALQRLLPSWFVPPVGIVVAVISAPPAASPALLTALWLFGVGCYAVLLPLTLLRLVVAEPLPPAARPALAILAAPASLCLCGYLALPSAPLPWVVLVLGTIAILMTTVIDLALLWLLRMPFMPSFAALTFPLVISANALLALGRYGHQWPGAQGGAQLLTLLGYVQLALASTVVARVAHAFWQARRQALRAPAVADSTCGVQSANVSASAG